MKVFAVLLVALTTAFSQAVGEEGSSDLIINFRTLFGRRRCLGTLLNSKWGITSAGCCSGAVSAEVGYIYDLSVRTSLYGTYAFIRNPINNACLIPVDFNTTLLNISYPSLFTGPVQQGQMVTTLTWEPEQGVDVKVMETVSCPPIIPNAKMFCTDDCVNSPGASAQVNGEIVGIVSWSMTCPQGGNAIGVFTRIYNIIDWIQAILDGSF